MSGRLTNLLPLVILALAVALRVSDPAAIEQLRLATFDEFQRLQPRVWEDADVRVVDLDDESLKRLGQWPWPRTQLALLVDRLAALGAAAIAFDVVFAEPDRTSPSRLAPIWAENAADPSIAELAKRIPDHDSVFAESIARAPVVLGLFFNYDQPDRRPAVKWSVAVAGGDPRGFLPSFTDSVDELPELEAAASGQGSFNFVGDRDGVIRRVPLFVRLRGGTSVNEELYPSLALEALRVAQGERGYTLKVAGGSGESAFGEATGITHVRTGRAIAPTDSLGRLWLYDTGYVAQRFVPAWQVLEPSFDAARIEGKIVFVGTSAAGLKDLRATPLNPSTAGVEVHAQAAEQMILGAYLSRPDWITGAEIAILAIFGAGLIFLLPRWGAVWCAAVALGAVVLIFASSWYAFLQIGWLVDPLYPSAVTLLLYLIQSFTLFRRTEAERQRVRHAFGRYMSPVMVERLARDPSGLRLGGETRDMTVLFSDIRGFTRISETMDAASLTRFLNRYLTPMTDIILGHGGTIDKYMGDAIMAFWNAPLDDLQHPVHAARAALDMVARLTELNRSWKADAEARGTVHVPIAIGIGLNTGSCSVGNMGSEQRLDYSVLGDAVNLASRLEGQARTYNVPIIIGEATHYQLPGFACVELDRMRVKGKTQPASIYALLGDEAVAASSWFCAAVAAQNEMLAAYRERRWQDGRDAAMRVRAAAEGRLDGACSLYLARFSLLANQPPLESWDGVYEATEK
jgi:adenylate cyclase